MRLKFAGADVLALGEAQIQRREEFGKRDELLARGRIVDAVDDLALLRLGRFGGADIRLNHELLDELHRFELVADADAGDAAVLADVDLVFGEVEIERAARIAGLRDDLVGRP